MKLFVQLVGGLLAILGACSAMLFGVLFVGLFLYVGLYGWWIFMAVYFALPAILVSLIVGGLGWFIKKTGDKMKTQNKSPIQGAVYPPSYLLPAKKEPS